MAFDGSNNTEQSSPEGRPDEGFYQNNNDYTGKGLPRYMGSAIMTYDDRPAEHGVLFMLGAEPDVDGTVEKNYSLQFIPESLIGRMLESAQQDKMVLQEKGGDYSTQLQHYNKRIEILSESLNNLQESLGKDPNIPVFNSYEEVSAYGETLNKASPEENVESAPDNNEKTIVPEIQPPTNAQ